MLIINKKITSIYKKQDAFTMKPVIEQQGTLTEHQTGLKRFGL